MTSIEEAVQERVEALLSSNEESVSIPMAPLSEIASALHDAGFYTMNDDNSLNIGDKAATWETNGWQIDFWWEFSHENNKRYILSGSLWYGNFKLSKV